MSRISAPRSIVAVANPTPLPSGQDTQILTNVNGANSYSYPGYNFSGGDMFAGQSVDTSAIILNNPVNYNYLGGVLAPNGRIYCMAGAANHVGIINPYNNTIDTTTISITNYPDLSAGFKFWGGVLGTNGKIYCVPRRVNYVGIIDPVTNTFDSTSITFTPSQTGVSLTSDAYATGALGSNGNIYFCPYSATKIMRLRTIDNSLNFIDVSNTSSVNWDGSVCGPDGNVYFLPRSDSRIIRVDVGNETVSIAFNTGVGQSGFSSGGVLGLDGIIYCMPNSNNNSGGNSANKLLFYDVLNNIGGTITANLPRGGEKFYGGVLAPNGKIYMIPATWPNVATIKTGIPRLPPWMMAPEFNKL
jgi:hypothetical protein